MTSTAPPTPPPNPGALVRYTNWLIRWRAPLLIISLVLLVLAWPVARKLAFEQSVESLYAPDDPHLLDYLESKANFGGDEFVIVAFRDPDLFEEDRETLTEPSAQRIRQFARDLGRVGGVNAKSTQLLPEALNPSEIKVRLLPVQSLLGLVEGILVGSAEDRQTTAIVLRLIPLEKTKISRGETIARIRRMADEFEREHGLPTYIVGEPVQVHDMFQYVEDDGRVLFRASLIILAFVILILFRSARWVVLPLLIVLATVLATEAILVLSGIRLSMVSSMLNALVTIMGIATITHMTVYFREFRRTMTREEAFRQTFLRLAPAVFWVTATTAGGFAALLSTHNTPTQSFGLMMALATMLLLVTGSTILPGGVLIGSFSPDPLPTPAEKSLERWLARIAHWVESRPYSLSAALAAVTAFAALGFWRLEVETDFSKNFRASSPIVRSLTFFESHLGGAGTWEVNFPAEDKLTPEYLRKVHHLADRLRKETPVDGEPQLTKVMAITDGIEIIPPHTRPDNYRFLFLRVGLLKEMQPEFVPGLYNAESKRMRIVLRARERTPSKVKLRLIEQVREIAREEFPESDYPGQKPATTTGLFVLLAYIIESLLGDQLSSFLWAAGGMVAMMAVAYRSARIALVSLIPNLFPIVCVIGVMGWLGLPINIATAMIAAVSIGLTIDASIFYIDEYLRLRNEGKPFEAAIHETNQGVGQALVLSNFALIIGFSVLTMSHFIPLIYFGVLVDVAMIGGLVGNLILLPLLLKWVGGKSPPAAPPTPAPAVPSAISESQPK